MVFINLDIIRYICHLKDNLKFLIAILCNSEMHLSTINDNINIVSVLVAAVHYASQQPLQIDSGTDLEVTENHAVSRTQKSPSYIVRPQENTVLRKRKRKGKCPECKGDMCPSCKKCHSCNICKKRKRVKESDESDF